MCCRPKSIYEVTIILIKIATGIKKKRNQANWLQNQSGGESVQEKVRNFDKEHHGDGDERSLPGKQARWEQHQNRISNRLVHIRDEEGISI